jgi:tryptophan synthase beta chain
MVRISYDQKPYRRSMMQTWGATVVPSPSEDTNIGRKIRAEHPDSLGSLGIAISEAVEDAATRDDTKYALGSVLNHVLLHQTVIGLEAIDQLDMAGAYPDIVIGCTGGGSNFGGIALPFVREKLAGKDIKIIAVEPAACPSLTRGVYAYDFGDTGGLAPLMPMHTLGHNFMPAGIHSGGLRYHGMSPLISHLYNLKLIEARAHTQRSCFEAGLRFARSEGIIPAPEPTHAIRATIDEALKCKEEGVSRTILFNLCGHGHFDMAAWDSYISGAMVDYELPDAEIQRALRDIESMPRVPVPA